MLQTARLALQLTTNDNVSTLMSSRFDQVAFLPLFLATANIKSGN